MSGSRENMDQIEQRSRDGSGDEEPPFKRRRIIDDSEASFTERFPTVFDLDGQFESAAPALTKVDLQLMQLSGSIRGKREWHQKILNPEIKQKWVAEAKDQGASDAAIKYVFDEIEQHYINCIDGVIVPSPVDGVYQADGLISESIRQDLLKGVAKLENVDESMKDWHPGSNNQVLDLVHPSLYPYIIGVSRVTVGCPLPWRKLLGSGKAKHKAVQHPLPPCKKQICTWPTDAHLRKFAHPDKRKPIPAPGLSEKYQWLPSEFKIARDGKVTIKSYINNLHPHVHAELYKTLEQIFEQFVPLYNRVLTDVLNPRNNRIQMKITKYPPDEKTREDFSDDDEYNEWYKSREPIQPSIPAFKGVPKPKITVNLNGQTVQVITKIANIHLTPEKPDYAGGVWHVEGMENERIIATGIYYYDVCNITESQLDFRVAVGEPVSQIYQDDHHGVEAIFGLVNNEPLVQPLGGVLTEQNRCIVFPNLFQHKVSPFKLVDPLKPGHRKIVCFFLVDPATPVMSTMQVPPQQISWYLEEVIPMLSPLPTEIWHQIANYIDWPMTLEEAKKHREELMKERKFVMDYEKENFYERIFSLCEH